jgi:hypothetical protein
MNNQRLRAGEEKFLRKALKNMSEEELAQLTPHMLLPSKTGKKLSTKDGMNMLRDITKSTQGLTPGEIRHLIESQGVNLP